ncbi:MAG: alpha/beta fold hydrolase [Myxococcota bacterium]
MWTWLACTPGSSPVEGPPPVAPADPTGIETGAAPPDPTEPTDPTEPDEEPLPVVFVHGINGSADNWSEVIAHLIEAGWPADRLYARTFDDPEWGCNVDNAATIDAWVGAVLAETGAPKVHLVAHSMGTLSSRYYVKNLGGTEVVRTYATLGGMHHGLTSSCSPDFPFKPCVWDEICATGEFVTQLNDAPSTPGELNWVSLYGTADETVPNDSSYLEGAENIRIEGVEHDGDNGLQSDEATFVELLRVLSYPTP